MTSPTLSLPVWAAWPPSSMLFTATPLPVAGFFMSLMPRVWPSAVDSVTFFFFFFGDSPSSPPFFFPVSLNSTSTFDLIKGATSFMDISVTSVPLICVMMSPSLTLPVASAWPPGSMDLTAGPLPVSGFFFSLRPSALPFASDSVTLRG